MTPGSADELWGALRSRVRPDALGWLAEAVGRVQRDVTALAGLFPAVGRKVGRQPLHAAGDHAAAEAETPGSTRSESGGAGSQQDQPRPEADLHDWTVDDAGRALLLLAAGDAAWGELGELYRFGDAAERRAVLRSLHLLPPPAGAGAGSDPGLQLVDDAVRTNDPRLLAAALGPYALARLSDDAFNQAVLKCVFVGVPLSGLAGVAGRANPPLARMLAAYARERVAAGRDVPVDVWPLVEAHPPHDELAAIEAELVDPVRSRREAAAAALAQRATRVGRPDPAPAGGTNGRRAG